MKKTLPLLSIAALFAALVFRSAQAAEGARQAMAVCAMTLVPSLLPFFALANLLSALGLPELLGTLLGGAAERLFRVSPAGAQAFFLGLAGGYPLGASVTADLRRSGRISRSEAERLLAFCNNSGPAFILGAAGGVFRSPRAGLLLYVSHVLAAIAVGVLLRGRKRAVPEGADTPSGNHAAPPPFSKALTGAVSRAVASTLAVCGYVVLFGALLGLAGPWLAALSPLTGAFLRGLLELGGGISAMAGLQPGPVTLAAAAFLLGWGGLSVHCQTLGVTADTDISCARHLAGRALCGLIAAVFTYLGALLLF